MQAKRPAQKRTCMESIEIIKIEQLKANLAQAISNGYADYVVHFYDPERLFSIDKVYLVDATQICLESNEQSHVKFTAQQLWNELDKYANDCYIYVYIKEEDQIYDIDPDFRDDKGYEHRWYVDEDNCFCIDVSLRWEI